MQYHLALLTALLLGCTSIGVTHAQSAVELTLDLSKGDTYRVKMSMENNTTQTLMGMQQQMQQDLEFIYSFEVLDVDRQGTADIDLTYEAVKVAVENPAGSSRYDSADPAAEPDMQTIGFAALLDQTIHMKMTRKGKIDSISGLDALLEHILDAYDLPEGPQRAQLREGLKEQFGDESMKSRMAGIAISYPEGKVAVGDSWTQEGDLKLNFSLGMSTTYTVVSIDQDVVELDVSSILASDNSLEPMKMQGIEMVFKLSGTQTGRVIIDTDTGWTRSSTLTQELSGTVEMLPNEQIPEGMSWPIVVKTTNTLETVE